VKIEFIWLYAKQCWSVFSWPSMCNFSFHWGRLIEFIGLYAKQCWSVFSWPSMCNFPFHWGRLICIFLIKYGTKQYVYSVINFWLYVFYNINSVECLDREVIFLSIGPGWGTDAFFCAAQGDDGWCFDRYWTEEEALRPEPEYDEYLILAWMLLIHQARFVRCV
jgi:hypothetical protein